MSGYQSRRSMLTMRLLKVALIALAVLVVIGVGAGAYLASRLDKEHLVRAAQDAVKEATGRTLEVGGKVDLRIFPPALVVENVRFSNASWGSRPDMARARRVEVDLGLIPLITGTISIDRLILIEPDVLLETDGKDRANWHFGTKEKTGKPADSAPSLPAIRLGAFRIADGLIVYRDGVRGTETRVEIKSFDRRGAGFGRRYPLAVKGSVNGRPFEVKGTIGDPGSVLASGGVVELDLKISAANVQAAAKGRVVDLLGRADAHVQVKLDAKDVQDLGTLVGQKIPPLGSLKAHATVDRNKGRLGVSDLDLALSSPGGLQVTARGSIRDVIKPAGAALDVKASVPESQQAPAFLASGRVEDIKDGVRVADLKITSGKNELKGDLEYHSGKARPRVVTRLEGSGLDLGFLAKARGEAASPEPKASGPLFSREPVPLGHLRALDADTQLSVGALVLPNRVTLHNVAAKLELNDGRLRVEPVSFLAGGGTVTAALTMDASGDTANLGAKLESREVILSDLLAPTPLGEKIKGGATNVELDVTSTGNSPHEWAAGLTGRLQIQIGKAEIKAREVNLGGDLLTRIAEAINPFRKTDPDVHLECAVMRLPVRAGIARSNRGIGAETDKVSVLSSGTVDLGKEMMDVNMRPRVKEGIGLGGAQLAKFVRVSGPLTDPKLGLDFGATVGTAASIAAGVATGGLSLLGEQLLKSATAENACKVALGSSDAESDASAAGKDRSDEPAPTESSAVQPAETKKERGFFDRIFGN